MLLGLQAYREGGGGGFWSFGCGFQISGHENIAEEDLLCTSNLEKKNDVVYLFIIIIIYVEVGDKEEFASLSQLQLP